MGIHIVSLARQNLDACGRILDGLEQFRRLGINAAAAGRLLGAALEEGRSDLRVALEGSEVVGVAWLVPRGGFDRGGFLRLIAVDACHRRSGAGRHLVEALEETHLRYGGIFVLASSDNEDARRFYERLGYHQVGVLPGYLRPDLDERIFFKAART